jgi:RNA polymerase sigma factor (TIGR02999 family)
MDSGPDITELLAAWTGGNREALDALMPTVIDELKRIAGKYLANEPHARTLQATALVNEAYLRLVQVRPHSWESRGQFYALTAQIMRRILVDHARSQLALQRGAGAAHVALDKDMKEELSGPKSLVGLDDALLSLEHLDARKSRIVELRVFGGLTNGQAAEALGISERTVIREWQFAKAWLARELNYALPETEFASPKVPDPSGGSSVAGAASNSARNSRKT